MTYGFYMSPLFRAHNQARQAAVPVGGDYLVDEYFECSKHKDGGVQVRKAYVYGELRTSGYSSEQQNGDVAFRNQTSMLSEGWQLRTNAFGTTNIDDSIYGVVSERATLYLKNSYGGDTSTSDAEETRIFGLRLAP